MKTADEINAYAQASALALTSIANRFGSYVVPLLQQHAHDLLAAEMEYQSWLDEARRQRDLVCPKSFNAIHEDEPSNRAGYGTRCMKCGHYMPFDYIPF